ncbi:MAG: hypothetical protein H7039_05650 [Bryobacteraceae bacterium]|nr:hypothetical protein [Bryobacteraceae bacterium]
MQFLSNSEVGKTTAVPSGAEAMFLLVRGPRLPDEVEFEGLLTADDHKALTLDHIERTSTFIWRLEIRKRA